MLIKWSVYALFVAAYLTLVYWMWLHSGDDAGQAMPMNAVAFLAVSVVGGVLLLVLGIILALA